MKYVFDRKIWPPLEIEEKVITALYDCAPWMKLALTFENMAAICGSGARLGTNWFLYIRNFISASQLLQIKNLHAEIPCDFRNSQSEYIPPCMITQISNNFGNIKVEIISSSISILRVNKIFGQYFSAKWLH